jgi:MFS family permease
MSDIAIPAPPAPAALWMRAGRLFVIFMGPSLGGLVPLGLAIAQPALAAHFGGGEAGRAAAVALFSWPSLMIMVGAPLGGYFAERLGYRRTLLASLLVYGVTGSAGLVIDGFIPLLIARLILGVAGGTVMAVYLALAAAYYDGTARAKVLGFAVACSSIAGALALFLCGRLVDSAGWRGPFVLYLAGFVTLAVAWVTVRGPFHTRIRVARVAGAPGPLRLIAQLWPVYLILLIMSVGTFTSSSGGPFLLKANGILAASDQGAILSAGSTPAIVTAAAYGFLRRWFSDRALMAVTAALQGLGLCFAVPLHNTVPLLLAFAVTGIGTGFKAPSTASVLMAEAPESVRAAAAGLSFSGIFLGQFLAPNLLALLDPFIGIHGAFLAIGGTLLAVSVIVVVAGIGKEKTEETA